MGEEKEILYYEKQGLQEITVPQTEKAKTFMIFK